MPSISKQGRGSNGQREVIAGSILSRAIPIANLRIAPLKILLYGDNRVGKSSLACQFPKPLLLISFEQTATGGAESVRRMSGVNFLQEGVDFSGSAGAMSLVQELVANPDLYATVVLDHVTAMQDMILREVTGQEKLPNMGHWTGVSSDQYRERSEKLRDVIQPFIDLPQDTVIIAKEKDHNPPKEERVTASGKVSPDMRPSFIRGLHTGSYLAADLGGATAKWLQDRCDSVCRLYVEKETVLKTFKMLGKEVTEERETGKYTRWLRIGYHPNFAAGIRSCDPANVPELIQDPTADKLIAAIRG